MHLLPRSQRRRKLGIESLEGRRLLAVTVGIYDENVIAANTVDFVAAGSTVTNTEFATDVANAYAQNRGGVIDGSVLSGRYEFGAALSKSIPFAPTSPQTSTWGIGAPGSNRTISGTGAFATVGVSGPASYSSTTFAFGAISDGNPNEHVVQIGITALSLNGRDYGVVTTTAHLSGGGALEASRQISEPNGQGDTFFGLSAPAGEYITGFTIGYAGAVASPDFRLWFDDIGFITDVVTPNQAPTAENDMYTISEDGVLNVSAPGVLINDSDPDGDPLSAQLVSGTSNGRLDFNADGSFIYTPDPNFHGVDRFAYIASDGNLSSSLAVVRIDVTSVNDSPVVNSDTFSIAENSPNDLVVGTAVATDPDGDEVTFAIVSGNTDGAFRIDPLTGQIRVANTAALDYETTPEFNLVVRATDSGELSGQAIVTVVLTDVVETTVVQIDIKPNDSRNAINVRSRGKVEVAILSSVLFDAQSVDVGSLRFGRVGDEDSLSRNPSSGEPRYDLIDLNGDGLLDLVVRFELELTGFNVGDTKGVLNGRTIAGAAFQGEDRITTK
ncbi:MAG: Ig-like domain-containing protein [Pirellulaceae bacterium]